MTKEDALRVIEAHRDEAQSALARAFESLRSWVESSWPTGPVAGPVTGPSTGPGTSDPGPVPTVPGPIGDAPVVRARNLEELMSALRGARDGMVFVLGPGQHEGTIVLPTGDFPRGITVRGSGNSPSETVILPRKESPGIVVHPGTHGVTIECMTVQARSYQNTHLVLLGSLVEESPARQPSRIVLRRLRVLADPAHGSLRGVSMHSGETLIEECEVLGFKSESEAQAISSWNGPGPYTIRASRLSAAGEVIMFGSSRAPIGRNPSGILIEDCVLEKTPDMDERHPSGRDKWMKKNIIELKRAENVVIRRNVLRNSYNGQQQGFAVVLTVRADSGRNPFAAIRDVLFEENDLVACAAGFNIMGRDDLSGYIGEVKNIWIRNNRIEVLSSMGGASRVFRVLTGAEGVHIIGNVVTGDPRVSLVVDSPPTNVPPWDPSFVPSYPIKDLRVIGNTLIGDVIGRGYNWSQAIRKFVRGFVWENNNFVRTVPPRDFPPRD